MLHLPIQPLTADAYSPFGAVLEPGAHAAGVRVNEGSALRFDHIAELTNRRDGRAKLNIAHFECQPRTLPFTLRVLEKHPYSTQLFTPLGAERYVVVVATGDDRPDWHNLRAFLASGRQGITYHPGVWHHTLMALDQITGFSCMVWEDGSEGDCSVYQVPECDQRVVSL
jgi:ureidoglycolate lyase